MHRRAIREDVFWLGAIDWGRRLFDSLIPIPDGTSYNAYLIRGRDKTALLDTVDPTQTDVLLEQLKDIGTIDYIVTHHAEQDHSGSLPAVLQRHPQAKIVCMQRCVTMLQDLYGLEDGRFLAVKDGGRLDLGGKTLDFFYMPWVHWPETMVSHLREEGMLFTGDFFGSHLATADLYAVDRARVYDAAKRYYAQIMMPFGAQIAKHLERLAALDIRLIAPTHGPIYQEPEFILSAYREWVTGEPKNLVALPYISMHGSTREMVETLISELAEREVGVEPFDLSVTDLGKLAMALVDARTIVFGTPVVLGGAHPSAVQAAYLANLLRPKARHAAVIGSFGWGEKAAAQLQGLLDNLKAEFLPPVFVKGAPGTAGRQALAALAEAIAERHRAAR